MSEEERSRNSLLLPVVLAAVVVYGFDTNVVNVALPALQRELGAGPVALELVVGGYAFTYAAGLVTGGRLGDLVGHRRMFLFGLAAFTTASVLCGVAGTATELVLARLLQGLAAAAMVPQVLAVITTNFAGPQRLRALAWFGVSGAVSGVLGQVLGGLILVADVFGLGWRTVFLLNLPVGAVVYALAHRVLPRVAPAQRPAFDPVGVVAVSGALALALLPLIVGRGEGWPWWTLALLAASVPATALALAYERRLARRGGNPVLDLTLFAHRTFSAGLGVAVAFMAFFGSSIFVTSLLLQNGLGLSPLQAGLAFVPFCLLGVVAPLLGGRLVAALGPAAVIRIGCAVDAAAIVVLATLLSTQGSAVDVPWLVTGLALIGLGNTLILPTYLGVTLAAVRPEQAGAASGTLNTTQQFAGSAARRRSGHHALDRPRPRGRDGRAHRAGPASGPAGTWSNCAGQPVTDLIASRSSHDRLAGVPTTETFQPASTSARAMSGARTASGAPHTTRVRCAAVLVGPGVADSNVENRGFGRTDLQCPCTCYSATVNWDFRMLSPASWCLVPTASPPAGCTH